MIARIERMNRRLSLNQCSRKSSVRRMSHPCRQGGSDSEVLDNVESGTNYVNTEKIKDEQLDDSFPDDIPLIKLTPFGKQNDTSDTKSFNEESLVGAFLTLILILFKIIIVNTGLLSQVF